MSYIIDNNRIIYLLSTSNKFINININGTLIKGKKVIFNILNSEDKKISNDYFFYEKTKTNYNINIKLEGLIKFSFEYFDDIELNLISFFVRYKSLNLLSVTNKSILSKYIDKEKEIERELEGKLERESKRNAELRRDLLKEIKYDENKKEDYVKGNDRDIILIDDKVRDNILINISNVKKEKYLDNSKVNLDNILLGIIEDDNKMIELLNNNNIPILYNGYETRDNLRYESEREILNYINFLIRKKVIILIIENLRDYKLLINLINKLNSIGINIIGIIDNKIKNVIKEIDINDMNKVILIYPKLYNKERFESDYINYLLLILNKYFIIEKVIVSNDDYMCNLMNKSILIDKISLIYSNERDLEILERLENYNEILCMNNEDYNKLINKKIKRVELMNLTMRYNFNIDKSNDKLRLLYILSNNNDKIFDLILEITKLSERINLELNVIYNKYLLDNLEERNNEMKLFIKKLQTFINNKNENIKYHKNISEFEIHKLINECDICVSYDNLYMNEYNEYNIKVYDRIPKEEELLEYKNNRLLSNDINYDSTKKYIIYVICNSILEVTSGYTIRSHNLINNLNRSDKYEIICVSTNEKYVVNKIRKYENVIYLILTKSDYMREMDNLVNKSNSKIIIGASNYQNMRNALLISHKYNLKSIYEIRGLWQESYRANNSINMVVSKSFYDDYNKKEKEVIDNSDIIVTITDELLEYVKNTLNGIIKRSEIIYNSFDYVENLFHSNSSETKILSEYNKRVNNGKLRVGYFGSILYYEGLEMLIDAITNINSMYNNSISLLLIGNNKMYNNASSKRIQELKELFSRKFINHIEHVNNKDIIKYFNEVDLFVLPRLPLTVCEIVSPLKPFEIFGMKKPLLMSDCECLKSIAKNGKNCMLFKKGDINDLQRKLIYLLNNDYPEELINNAYNFVINERNWDVQIQKYYKIFDDIYLNYEIKNNDEVNNYNLSINNNYRKKILFIGHDMKFIEDIIRRASNDYEVRIDKWLSHSSHDLKITDSLLEWADIIFCEWFLGNVLYCIRKKRRNQLLYVRLHRMESELNYYNDKLDLSKIDKIYFVSESWKIEHHKMKNISIKGNIDILQNNYNNRFDFNITEEYIRDKYKRLDNNEIHLGIIGILPIDIKNPVLIFPLISLLLRNYKVKLSIFSKSPNDLKWMIENKQRYEIDFIEYENLFKSLNYLSTENKNFSFNNYYYIESNQIDFYKEIDFLLVPSNIESFHKSSLEIIMCGGLPLFFGNYINRGACMNWPVDLCFQEIELVNKFIENFINMRSDKRYEYINNLREFYRINYSVETVYNKLIMPENTHQKLNPNKIIYVDMNFNIDYLDGSVIFLNNLLRMLNMELLNKFMVIVNIYNNDENKINKYIEKQSNVIYMKHSDNIYQNLIYFNTYYDPKYILIRGYNLDFNQISENISKKIKYYFMTDQYYLLDDNLSRRYEIVVQTDEKKYQLTTNIQTNKKIKLLYPTYIPYKLNNEIKYENDNINKLMNKIENNNDYIKIIYSGTLRDEYLSLEMLSYCNKLLENKNIIFILIVSKIHGKSDYIKKITQIIENMKKFNNFYYYDKLPHKETINILKNCDYGFLFKKNTSINNNEISLKFLEYLYYKIKPIINSENHEHKYFNNYNLIINIKETLNIYNLLINNYNNKIDDFIKNIDKYNYLNVIKQINNIFC